MKDLLAPRPYFDISLQARRDSRLFTGDRAFVAAQKRLQRRASRRVGALRAVTEGLEEVYLDAFQSLDQELFEHSLEELLDALRGRMGWPF